MAATNVPVVRTVAELRAATGAWRKAGKSVALVPTMGSLHAGHMSLVRLGKSRCDRVVTSIFVNPAQFAPHEDFATYPREEEGDLAKLSIVGCDLVWAPSVKEMYGDNFSTFVVPGGAAEGLESVPRPHFFRGVATVCCKLFTQVAPDVTVFGEKDYQQLCVVRQMVRDLDLPLEILAHATVRDPTGLALSSRNKYLSPDERSIAPRLHEVLRALASSLASGADIEPSCDRAAADLNRAGFTVDYVECRNAQTLKPVAAASDRPLRVLAAARLGKTRLIDNVAVEN